MSRIIYTHHHWDHVYGACEFDAPVVAHVVCREILLEETEKPWIRNWSLTIDHATHLENVIIEPH